MNHLLTLPPEVMGHALFPFLKWNDLLRLRRVSPTSKAHVHAYVNANPQLTPEIEIGGKETERNLRAFLDLGLPSTKIFLENGFGGSEFYQENSEELSEFLEAYGSVVTHLRVAHFSLYCSGMERTFLEGLVNLRGFETQAFDITNVDMVPVVPQVFENVTDLKLIQNSDGEEAGVNGCIELLTACRMLKSVKPLYSFSTKDNSLNTKLFRFLDTAIRQREDNPEAPLSHLEAIDLPNYDWIETHWEDENTARNAYRQFLRTCAVHGIRLRNVEVCDVITDFVKNRGHLQLPFESLSLSLDSATPYNWIWITETEMPILKDLVVGAGSEYNENELEDMRNIAEDRVISCRKKDNWPKLTSLALAFELPEEELEEDSARLILREARDLFGIFFEGVVRTTLRELSIMFLRNVENGILTAESLTTSCPNLTKLKLDNWGGNNEQFVRLWEGLSNLEVVRLDECNNLGDDGFIGPDVQNPVFLKLKKLKDLTLLNLNDTPGITNNLFSTVIRHLSLTHFDISSWRPLIHITRKGIKSLLGGRFEECIQKFSFENWSLHGSTPRKKRNLQKLFAHRLKNML